MIEYAQIHRIPSGDLRWMPIIIPVQVYIQSTHNNIAQTTITKSTPIMNFPSKLVETAVNQLASLPGIGKKTALRLVLHLLKKEKIQVEKFGSSFIILGCKALSLKSLDDFIINPFCLYSQRCEQNLKIFVLGKNKELSLTSQ